VDKVKDIGGVLRKWLITAEKIVVVGVGNELRRDDFVGVEVVRRLKGKVPRNVMLIESETVPESFLETITQFHPTHVLIIDAGLTGLKLGQVKVMESSEALGPASAVSTHALPLRIFCEYLEKTVGSKIALAIIQPKTTDFGEGLTKEIDRTAQNLTETLTEILNAR
jgi:hydrogenase 3 maturation protease